MARIIYGSLPIMNGYWPYGGFSDLDPGDDTTSGTWVVGNSTAATIEAGDDDSSVTWEPGDQI